MVAATSVVRAQQIILDEVQKALKPFDLTFARYEALVLLYFSKRGALPLGKMGERLQVHPTSVTSAIDRLERQGFVRRQPDAHDRRSVIAEITDTGNAVVQQATAELTRMEFGLSKLSDRDLETLAAVLGRLRLAAGAFPK
jgi:DNA-binding MarR family transcriptional regulator